MRNFRKISISTSKLIALGFVLLILLGCLLLCLPISSSKHTFTPVLDCLFTATSSVCVTGLVVYDTASHWSAFGQIVIICLIQIGGIGFMSLVTFFLMLAKKRISIQNRMVLMNSYNISTAGGIVRIAKHVLIFTFLSEFIGAVLFMFTFIPRYGIAKGIGVSIFHSISSFCNSGFDIFGGFNSLTQYISSAGLLIITMLLIVVGGIGFYVMEDLISKRKNLRAISFHSKIVLSATLVLILFAFAVIFILEYNNPSTLGALSLPDKIIQSFFNSITPRTAGFNTLNMASLTNGAVLMIIILMFIGGSPGSTAGGIKTTTISVLLITVYSWIRGKENIEIFHRKIGYETLKKSISIAVVTFALILLDIFILSVTESAPIKSIIFEVFSAFGTVGLTMGLTPYLTAIGKIIIITAMFIGRLGPLTIALAMIKETENIKGKYQYPEGDILLG